MPTLDELKSRIKAQASEHPEQFFPVAVLESEGFHRDTCTNCGTTFWATDTDREVCGEPDCGEGYTFIGDAPTEKTFDVVSAWAAWSSFMADRGYTPIDRYPLAARWRDDTEVVRASIYDFQPYVVSGQVEPPANPLVVPQFCFRSNDIDNVGITGRHYTGFIMDGQCAFTPPDDYDQDKYFKDMLDWLISPEGMAIDKDEVVLHEDSWGGGGNLGACIEFFVRGLELFNQVYMTYVIDDTAENGYRDLDTKVLDMGMGHERIVWITHGSETSYEANMKQVVDKLYANTGVDPDKEIWTNFLPYAGHLNLDEVDDIDEEWAFIAEKIGEDVDTLKAEVLPAAALYAIADHTRCLLVALNDGLLPSNSGERHSLRVMARRCMEFIDRYNWDLDLTDVLEWHAAEFGELYPELRENIGDIKTIMRHEEQKYEKTKQEAERLIAGMDEEEVTEDTLIELYDSQGITPDMLQRHGIDIDVPSNFYQLVSEKHAGENIEGEVENNTVDVSGLSKTERLYFEDEYLQEFEARVIAVVDDMVVLDKTAFYPTSGGQEHDTGYMDDAKVVDVINQDGVILHRIRSSDPFPEEGDIVACVIDWERRTRHRNHHSATHLINAAAKKVLGNHVWQAGSHKSEEKARLDITHYEKLDRNTLQQIEDIANNMVEQDLPVEKEFLPRTEAEKQFGFRIYQGGAVPGKTIRVVRVGDTVDVEACGGTHVNHTGELGTIRIIGSKKIQDGTIRLEYVAGDVAEEHEQVREEIRNTISEYLDVEQPLEEIADIFSVEIDQLPRIVERFVDEWVEHADEIDELIAQIDTDEHEDVTGMQYTERPRDPQRLFEEWKKQEKDIDQLQKYIEEQVRNDLLSAEDTVVRELVPTEDVGMLIRTAKHVVGQQPEKAVILVGDTAVIGAAGEKNNQDMVGAVSKYANTVQGGKAFAKGFQLRQKQVAKTFK